ncbi:MAG: hypothetical protein COA78_07800 [Blastopirellula sp.]|nr:MAG: hypothetical protein COA78_07800 [Blastopirellula sp.]
MTLLLDLPWNEIEEWHAKMCDNCNVAITVCSDVLKKLLKDDQTIEQLEPLEILRALLENKTTCNLFGTPEGNPVVLPRGSDFSSEAERQRWGRRVHFHLQALCHGINNWEKIGRSEENLRQIEMIQILEDRFATVFDQCLPSVEELKRAMRPHANHRIFTHFIRSQIDPILYSSLFYLNRKELRISTDLSNYLVNNVKETLLQVLPYKERRKISPPINDDANLWWGQYELIKREGENYQVGEYTGYAGAAKVCWQLVYKSDRICKSPSEELAIHENPPEVYGQKRTKLLMIIHCINLSKLMPSKADPKLSQRLSDFISRIINAELEYAFYSMHYLGLGLQVSSVMKLYHQEFIENRVIKTTVMVDKTEGTITGDKQTEQYHVDGQEVNSKPESKAWSLGNGVFEIVFPDKTVEMLKIDTKFSTVIEELIALGGVATQKDLEENEDISNPGKCLQRGLNNSAYKALHPHITMAGSKNGGGYRTTIQSRVDKE